MLEHNHLKTALFQEKQEVSGIQVKKSREVYLSVLKVENFQASKLLHVSLDLNKNWEENTC